jgi:hypothetical protein
MRATVDATSRAAFFTTDPYPVIEAIARQRSIDFGGVPTKLSATLGAVPMSDDFYGTYVWGDSCVLPYHYLIRLVNMATIGLSSSWYMSYTLAPQTPANWNYTALPNGPTVKACCRIGVYPKVATYNVYVWYQTAAGFVVRAELTPSTDTWSSTTGLHYPGACDALAIHPISASEAILVGHTGTITWLQYISYSGSWTFSDRYNCWSDDTLSLTEVYFSDAVKIGTQTIISVNLSATGAAHSVRWDGYGFSQPSIICGGNADWAGYMTRITGMEVYNSRCWAVVSRAIEASDVVPQATHIAILSTADGLHWRDEDFVGKHLCFGKLLYDAGYEHCYVVGNAVVYEGHATRKLGTDVAARKRDLTEIERFTLTTSGPNATAELGLYGADVSANMTTDPRLYPGEEISLSLAETGNTQTEIMRGHFVSIEDSGGYGMSQVKLTARGPISRLSGTDAWQHPTGFMWESPEMYYSDFNFEDTGAAKITVRQETGTWTCYRSPESGKFRLKGEEGLALLPRSFNTPWFSIMSHMRPHSSVDGCFIVFYWEDENNYWRAGYKRQPPDPLNYNVWVDAHVWPAIEQIVDGVAVERAAGDLIALHPFAGLVLYVVCIPGKVQFWTKWSESGWPTDDLSSEDTIALTVDVTADVASVPVPHHIGLETLNYLATSFWTAWEWSNMDWAHLPGVGMKWGVAEAVNKQTIYDVQGNFVAADVGRWIYVNGTVSGGRAYQGGWRQIAVVVSAMTLITSEAIWDAGSTGGHTYPGLGNIRYCIYEERSAPYIEVKDIAVCDGRRAWTVDEISTGMMEMAGVSRTTTPISVPTFANGGLYMNNIDLRMTDATPVVTLHAAAPAETAQSWRLYIASDYLRLGRMQDSVWVSWTVYPTAFPIPGLGYQEIRVVFRDNYLYVYAGDRFLGAFWDVRTSGSGYVGSEVITTTTEFPQMIESFILDAGQPVTASMAELLRGRPALMIERQDGSITLSQYETHADLGTWATTVTQTTSVKTRSPSLLEVEGADVRQLYLDTTTARRGILYRKSQADSAEGIMQTMTEAARASRLARDRAAGLEAKLLLPDISAELEDQVTIEGTDYILQGFSMQGGISSGKVQWDVNYHLRTVVAEPTVGKWQSTQTGASPWGVIAWG